MSPRACVRLRTQDPTHLHKEALDNSEERHVAVEAGGDELQEAGSADRGPRGCYGDLNVALGGLAHDHSRIRALRYSFGEAAGRGKDNSKGGEEHDRPAWSREQRHGTSAVQIILLILH